MAAITIPAETLDREPIMSVVDSDKWDRSNQSLKFAMAAAAVSGAFVLAGLGGPHDGPILCPLRVVTGVPCPLCGMTTAFTHMAAGNLSEAFVASPAGPLVFVAAIFIALTTAVLLMRRRRLSLRIPRLAYAPAAAVVAGVWLYQLFHIGPFA